MSTNMYYVYAVYDPETQDPIYIGITRDLRKRWAQHKKAVPLAPFPKWLRSQLERGIEPVVKILVVEQEYRRGLEDETAIISGLKARRCALLNGHGSCTLWTGGIEERLLMPQKQAA